MWKLSVLSIQLFCKSKTKYKINKKGKLFKMGEGKGSVKVKGICSVLEEKLVRGCNTVARMSPQRGRAVAVRHWVTAEPSGTRCKTGSDLQAQPWDALRGVHGDGYLLFNECLFSARHFINIILLKPPTTL